MKPITYSLQFRGTAVEDEPGALHKHASAPGYSLETKLEAEGLRSRYAWSPDDTEAQLRSLLSFVDEHTFTAHGTITFGRGHVMRLHGSGELAPTADPELRQGIVVWNVDGGEGQFAGASGRITSNFLLSRTGELTDHHLGVVFSHRASGHGHGDGHQNAPNECGPVWAPTAAPTR